MITENKNAKLVVIMGSTGVGKSKLSVELARTFFPAEIINCDKMQVYQGLNVTTNKITEQDQLNVPHHLLDHFDPATNGELSSAQFRSAATSVVSQIHSRRHLPILVGGSTSFIYALVTSDPDHLPSNEPDWIHSIFLAPLRYDVCFIWVDVALPILFNYLEVRLDSMLRVGMFDELADFYNQYESYTSAPEGLKKSIGVPEFEPYFRRFPSVRSGDGLVSSDRDEEEAARDVTYEEARRATKENTCQLAAVQVEKIKRLKGIGWNIQRLDATEVFRAALASEHDRAAEIWNKNMLGPAIKIVKAFLQKE